MFEQSILAQENAANKTRALAASFGVQTLVVAVAILIPLLIGEHMPRVQLWTTLNAPSRPQPEPTQSASTERSAPSILRPPSRVFPLLSLNSPPRGSIGATIISDTGLDTIGDAPGLGVPNGVTVISTLAAVAPPVTPAPTPTVPKTPEKPRPVGGDVQAAKLIRKIVPLYPPLAKQARVSGTVRLTGVIAKDGSIEQLQVESGNPLLIPAAVAAVKQWLYRPTFLNGQAVEVIAPIDVIFTLSQ